MYEDFVAEAKRRGRCLPDLLVRTTASDGETLIAGVFGDDAGAVRVVVLFHGAGANMNVGYLDLVKALHETGGDAVLVPDVRGHGMSSGDRGYAPSKEQVWSDVDTWIDFARARYPRAQVVLAGHSAGSALALNYLTRHRCANAAPIAAIVMVAPYWGARQSLRNPSCRVANDLNVPSFSTSDAQVFMAYALSGEERLRREIAVRFNYPDEMARLADLVVGYTPEMAMAVSPLDVERQLRELQTPTLVLAAEDDSLFCPDGLAAMASDAGNPAIHYERTAGDHLSCLYQAGPRIARWLQREAA